MKLDIITPVGPGHTQAVEQAKASVQRAIKAGLGPFSEVRHVVVDDTEGALGRSAARNQAVKASTADWLFFLDADDLLATALCHHIHQVVGNGCKARCFERFSHVLIFG